MKILVIALVVVLVVAGVTVVSANAAVPGDLLYGVDRGMETMRLNLAASPQERVQIELQAAQERLAEIEILVLRGNTAAAEAATKEMDETLDAVALEAMAARGEHGEAVGAVLDSAFDDGDTGGTLSNYCDGSASGQHPVGVRLAERYDVVYEDIMDWFCGGYGFGEIKLGYQISQATGNTPEQIFGMREQGLGWGEIAQVNGMIDDGWDANRRSTQTAGSENDNGNDDSNTRGPCDPGSSSHPHGQDLANQFNVPYEEIMGWFCQGYGFGEIELAYNISLAKNVPVSEVFAYRAGGMGWGEIMQQYGLNGNPGNKRNNGNNGNRGNNGNNGNNGRGNEDRGNPNRP